MRRCWLGALRAGDAGSRALDGPVSIEIDWGMKYQLIERYRAKRNMTMSNPRGAQIDLPYRDIHRRRGLHYLLEPKGQIARICHDLKIFEGKSVPPRTTRARLRGHLIHRAQGQRWDFTVDWVRLKLSDQAQRTVLCKDPFHSVDDREEKLTAGM
ncbi:proteasome accessory factor PafA2 family protein [Streptomyces sp. NBC_00341]|nr:proteasome accessory factor PafA2 family protein [Streptomyces sp. NBC_00341]